jgi:ataxin-3
LAWCYNKRNKKVLDNCDPLFRGIYDYRNTGYSVFVVRLHDGEPQALIDRPLTGTLTEADEAASLMLEPTSMPSSAATLSTSRKPNSSRHPTTSSPTAEGFEDEDMDLQRALQASLAGGDFDDDPDVVQYQPQPQPLSSRNHFGPSASTSTSRSRPQDTASHDAIQQSIARGQELLERTRREQELAFHEGLQYSYEAAAAGTSTGRRMRSQAQAPPTRTRSGDEEEEEMMRRALEASMKARKEAGADARGDDEDDSDASPFHIS